METLGLNIEFPIYFDVDGVQTPFYDLVLRKPTYTSVVMSLGDKIVGDVYYKDNKIDESEVMSAYIVYNDVRYALVNPPTIVREGLVSDNGELKGMTKYSFEFYHPMCQLSNLPFSDVAVSNDELAYKSQDKTFAWIGYLADFAVKLNKNLQGTEWVVVVNDTVPSDKLQKMSEVLSFDKNTIADALKTCYDTWEVPFIIDKLERNQYYDDQKRDYYSQGKRFVILFGLPSNEITSGIIAQSDISCDTYSYGYNFIYNHQIPLNKGDIVTLTNFTGSSPRFITNPQGEGDVYEGLQYIATENIDIYIGNNGSPATCTYTIARSFVFKFGQGVGLKNNSRTPKNNKIITRIAGYGSENNIPYGYPQIVWTGDQDWDYTINNASGVQTVDIDGETRSAMSYPIYKGIVGGQYVKLIKHPFTRTHLMPSVYVDRVNKKVNPNAEGYNPDIEIKDYYDADSSYPNPINPIAPSYEIHEFENEKPELGEKALYEVLPYDEALKGAISVEQCEEEIEAFIRATNNQRAKSTLLEMLDVLYEIDRYTRIGYGRSGGSYTYDWLIDRTGHENYAIVKYTSNGDVNFNYTVLVGDETIIWDDTMNDEGEYVQSYFRMTLPILDFDLYACAAITQEMSINMRSGACLGCTFNVQVDWDDYKKNFYKENGDFDPVPHTEQGDGHVRDASKYPLSNQTRITLIVQKDLNTFGTIMPNSYQTIKKNDKFVILGISLPTSYITRAEQRLDDDMREYMLENNIYYYDYPIKFDEYFLAKNPDILAQIRNNTTLRFEYANVTYPLYIKEMSIKWGQSPLPQYDITLSDDIEIVLNKIGQVTDDVSRMRVQVSQLANYLGVGSNESTGVTFEKLQEEFNKKLSKVADDIAEGRITFQQGITSLGNSIFDEDISSSNFMSGLYGGRGWKIDKVGGAEFESVRVRSFLEIVELLVNRMQAQEGDTSFSDNDQIDSVQAVRVGSETQYNLTLKEKWSGYVSSQQYGNILKGIINTLAAKQGNVSDVEEDDEGTVKDGVNSYYTSWMRVVGTHETNSNLAVNQIRVALYADSECPSGKNFKPCELMNIARWGCVDYSDPTSEDYEQVLASIKRRQQSFYISSSDGRIVKLRGVSKPKLEAGNYGTVLGIVPDFVKEWSSISARIQSDRDYLYAQGVIVEDFIKVNALGLPIINFVDCGEWVDGSTTTPTVGHGIYLVGEYSDVNLQYETHEVWHNGEKWRCAQHQPITSEGQTIYEEPTEGSSSWIKLLTKGEDGDSAAYYYEQEYAWSSMTETDRPYYYPSDISESSWRSAVPSKVVGKPYLWMRTRRFTWNANTKTYVQGAYSYVRLSGEDGTGIELKGTICAAETATTHFPNNVPAGSYAILTSAQNIFVFNGTSWDESTTITVNTGDCYILESDGHGWIWNGTNWQDVGQIKGADGYNSYVHLAWAHAIDPTLGYPTEGMGFTTQKSATDSYEYMGVYADQNSADSTTPSDYEWNVVKGFDAPVTRKSADSVIYRTDSSGKIISGGNQSVVADLYVQGQKVAITEGQILSTPSIYIGGTINISDGTATITINAPTSLAYNYLGSLSFVVRGTLDGVTYTAYDNIMIAESRFGADSIVLDLDNENDSVLYKADGSEAISEDPESTWYLYKGGNDISSLVTRNSTNCTLVATNCTATWTAETGTNRYRTFMVSDLTDKQASVIVRVTYDGTTYEKTFSITKLVGVDKFDILCSPNAVTYNTTTGDGSSKSVNVRIYRTDANAGTREIVTSLSDAGLYLYVYPEGATPTNYRRVDGTHYKGASGYTFTADTSYNAYHVLLLKALYNVSTYPQNTIDAETIPINKSKDGTSTLVADLTNEMDSVALTHDGQTTVTTTLTTTAKIYFGTTEETQTVAPTTTIQKSGVTFSSNINGVITITVAQGTTFTNDKLVIPITVKCAKGERIVDFTITGVRAGKDGSFTMYQLNPSVDLIKVSKDGTLSRDGFICNLLKTEESGTHTVYRTALPAGVEIRYAINEDVTKDNQTIYANSDGVVADGTIVNSSTTIGAFSVRNIYAVEEKGYGHFLILYLYDGNLLVDRETIPFVIDGEDGADAVRLDLDNENDTMLYDGGNHLISGNVTSNASLYFGGTKVASGVTWSLASQTNCTATITNAGKVTVTAMSATYGSVVVRATYQSKTYDATLSLKKLIGTDKYELICSPNSVTFNTSTSVASATSITIRIYKTAQNGSRTNISSLPTGYTLTGNGTFSRSYSGGYATMSVNTSQSSMYVSLKDASSVELDYETIPINKSKDGVDGVDGKDGKDGKDGTDGKMGRSFYYKGEWNEGTGDTFNVTDYEAPFFTYNNQKWVWVGANGTNIPVNSSNRPSNSNTNWGIMVADFNYLITKAFFTEFANLGSWYFNGDYMFSNKGYDANGNITYFTSGGRFYGEGSLQNTYTPITYINAATGAVHTSDIYATTSTFENVNVTGVLNNLIQNITHSNYSQYGSGDSTAFWVDPLKIGSIISIEGNDYAPHNLHLPWAGAITNAETGVLEDVIYGTRFNGNAFTLMELRQCVGKKIYIVPPTGSSRALHIYCGIEGDLGMLVHKQTLYDGLNDMNNIKSTGSAITTTARKVYAWEGNESQHYTILECKLGRYNGKECIYWEIEDMGSPLR